MIVAYTLGAITKIFIDKVPNKLIPIQNVIIGLISGIICFLLHIDENLLSAILIGIMSTMSAGGIADLKDAKNLNLNSAQG